MYVYMYFLDVGKVDIINSEVHCELQNHCPLLWKICYFGILI